MTTKFSQNKQYRIENQEKKTSELNCTELTLAGPQVGEVGHLPPPYPHSPYEGLEANAFEITIAIRDSFVCVTPSKHCCSPLGTSTIGGRQRSISQAFANGEMLRLAGGPARGWYPKQRQPRPASTEHLDRLHPQGSLRAWEAGTGSRKPLTLPPNLTPKFFNKSPREALRRVTSLLIRKGTPSR